MISHKEEDGRRGDALITSAPLCHVRRGTTVEELVARIRKAIDEDEQFAQWAAEEVGDGNWEQRGPRIVTTADCDREVADFAIVECIDHIVRHDPARVLRRVAADRKILELHRPWQSGFRWLGTMDDPANRVPDIRCSNCWTNDDPESYECAHVAEEWPCPHLLALAEAYDIEASSDVR